MVRRRNCAGLGPAAGALGVGGTGDEGVGDGVVSDIAASSLPRDTAAKVKVQHILHKKVRIFRVTSYTQFLPKNRKNFEMWEDNYSRSRQ